MGSYKLMKQGREVVTHSLEYVLNFTLTIP